MFLLKRSPTSRSRFHQRQRPPVFGSSMPTHESEGSDPQPGLLSKHGWLSTKNLQLSCMLSPKPTCFNTNWSSKYAMTSDGYEKIQIMTYYSCTFESFCIWWM